MVKHEVKVEFSNGDALKQIIEKAYFEAGTMGKITGKDHFITVDEVEEANAYSVLKELNNVTVKISNNDVIDGTMRFIIDNTDGDIRLSPVSIYCVKEEDRYSFY